ncbi:hypothetical protein IG631_07661 [Alternaria alternata]|nr:hypothetical protein IG631_07661 [Alternaria alternata]
MYCANYGRAAVTVSSSTADMDSWELFLSPRRTGRLIFPCALCHRNWPAGGCGPSSFDQRSGARMTCRNPVSKAHTPSERPSVQFLEVGRIGHSAHTLTRPHPVFSRKLLLSPVRAPDTSRRDDSA